jgi:hypothetical protein
MRSRQAGSLVGQAQVDAVGARQRAVEFRRGGRPRPHADAKGLAGGMRRVHAAGQRQRHRLRVAGAGEAAHADVVAVVDQGSGLVGRHALVAQRAVENSGGHR